MTGSAPARILIRVDLPAPLTPTRATRSPRSMTKLTFEKTVRFAVAFGDVAEFGHDAAARFGLRKAEVDGLFFGRNFDALDPLQFLDAALHLLGLGGLSSGSD